MIVSDKDDNVLVEGKAVSHRWAEYLDKLLKVEDGV